MDGCGEATAAMRGADGRFLPGCSGNPAGKPPGTQNRATLLAETLKEGEAALLVRALADRALGGDAVALRFCVGRLVAPAPRGRAIRLDLPKGVGPGDVVAAFNATLAAMAAGEITPEEALTVTRVLDGRKRALEALELERNLTSYRRVIPGDQAMRPQTTSGGAGTDEDEDDDEDDDDEEYGDDDGYEDEDDEDDEDGEDEAATAPPSPPSPARQAPSPESAPAPAPGQPAPGQPAPPDTLARLDALCAKFQAAAEERRRFGRAFAPRTGGAGRAK